MVTRVYLAAFAASGAILAALAAAPALAGAAAPPGPALRFDQPSNPQTGTPRSAASPGQVPYTRLDPDVLARLPEAAPTGPVPQSPRRGASQAPSPQATPSRPTAQPVGRNGQPATPATVPEPTILSAVPPAAVEQSRAPLLAYVSPARPMDIAPWQKVGSPYQIDGTWYIPAHEPDYDEIGTASWYGADFHGRTTASGEIFDMTVATGAHPTLPIPSLVEVTNLDNGNSIIVRINDRGPFRDGRLIDLSARGAELLGFRDQGTARVRVRYVGQAPREPLVTAQTLAPRPGTQRGPATQPAPRPTRPPLMAEATVPPGIPPGIPPGVPPGPTSSPAPRSQTPTGPTRQPGSITQVSNPSPRPRGEAQPTGAPGNRNAGNAAVAIPPGSGPMFLQVGAFASRANAERAGRAAGAIGAVRIVEPQPGATGAAALYRVLVGPYTDPARARAAVDQAGGLGLSGRLIRQSG